MPIFSIIQSEGLLENFVKMFYKFRLYHSKVYAKNMYYRSKDEGFNRDDFALWHKVWGTGERYFLQKYLYRWNHKNVCWTLSAMWLQSDLKHKMSPYRDQHWMACRCWLLEGKHWEISRKISRKSLSIEVA